MAEIPPVKHGRLPDVRQRRRVDRECLRSTEIARGLGRLERLASRALVATLTAATLLLSTSPASAFCRSTTCRTTAAAECETDENDCPVTGSKLFWPTSCLSYATNRLGTQDLDPVDTREAIRKTFQAWSDVPCAEGGIATMTFEERDPISCHKSEYNKTGPNVNVILFQDNDWRYRGIDGTLAKTSVTYNDDTGEIYDADIEVNAAFNSITLTDDPKKVEYDLQAILTHEVGHFIGIAHSPEPGSVMFASYTPGSLTQRKLTPDDVDAVCATYPPGATTACNVTPRGGFSGVCEDAVEEKSGCSVSGVAPLASGNTAGAGDGVLTRALFALGLGTVLAAGSRRRASRLRRNR